MSEDKDHSPLHPKDALTLADELIRKLDQESNKRMDHVTAEEKNGDQGAA